MIIVPAAERFYVDRVREAAGIVRVASRHDGAPGDRGSRRHRPSAARRAASRSSARIKDGREVEIDAKMSDLVRPNDTIRVRQRLI